MSDTPALTLDELRQRITVAGLTIREDRLEVVRKLVADAIAPLRRMDSRALATLEPAVRFDAGSADSSAVVRAPGTAPATAAPDASRQAESMETHAARSSTRDADEAATAVAASPQGTAGTSDELAYLGIRELAARFRRRALSPVELTTALLERIQRLEPRLNTLVTLTAERALADAKAAEAAIPGGEASALLGIPIAYKDLYATRGILTTAGSALLADWVPNADSTCVARLQAAGCVMLGKLITHEFAFGIQFPGHRFPPARNPWNVEHVPGGSSSGSGAALAAGLTVASLGSDTGGSIRGPAAFCGIAGLKPTYGRCSRAGVVTLSWTLDHTGPMARTAEDCAYLLQALAGHDPADPASSRAPVDDYVSGLGRGIRGLKIGVPRAYFFDGVTAEVEAAFDESTVTLQRLGASVEDVDIPSIWDAPSFMVILLAEAFAYHERDLRERAHLYGDLLREKMMAGALVTAAEYVQAQRLRERLRDETLAVLRRVDLLVTPTTPGTAPAFATVFDPSFAFPRSNMAPFNVSGLPTLAVPCGFSTAGLPMSLQVTGRPFDEATVLRAGHAYERATDWNRRPV
jgi:aspartyl-tRNA(Asn)/glutamyl-tRNA(Gln) amidotransferase subunit A